MSQLNNLQREAVEYLDGPLLVLAGPGTGKTEILSRKVEYILKNTDTSPNNILCLTFTDAGVTAMRERLLATKVEQIERVTISTYHSFGSQILAEYRNYADSFERNLDKPIAPVAQYKILKTILESVPINDILRCTSDLDTVTKDVRDIIKEAKSARLTAEDLETIAKINLDQSAEINAACADIFDHLVPRMKLPLALDTVYIPVANAIAGFVSSEPIVKNIYPEANVIAQSLSDAIAKANETNKLSPLSDWKKAFFEIDDEGRSRLKNRIANRKLLSVSKVMKVYQEKLAETGQFDFADMIEEAIVALKTDAGFKATLQERYQYILLDEFQDTNPSQFEIVHLLTDYERPSVMAVGDDDQAIYAFQGANASNLLDFANTYGAKVITLVENYRSTSEILAFSHKIADQIDDSFAKKRGTEKNLKSILNDLIRKTAPAFFAEEAPDVSVIEPTPSAPNSAEPAPNTPNSAEQPPETSETQKSYITRREFLSADSEYAWVASQINKLVEAGVPQKEIAVIAPKHKYLIPLVPYLKRYEKIDIAYERRENVLEDKNILELTLLARFLKDLADDKNPSHMLLEILSFDFWQLDPMEVMTAIQGRFKDSRRALDFLKDSENEKLKELAAWFADLALKSFNTPLELLLNEIVLRIADGLPEEELFAFYENLAVLRENLTNYLSVEKPRLSDFISFLDDYDSAKETILNTSPYRDSENAVQILSAHKSKGLQFGYVFMIAVDDNAWGRGKGNNNQTSLPKNLECIRHTGINKDEQLRLFFVAATRAKLGLIMTNSVQNFAGQKPHHLEYLSEYTSDETKRLTSPLLPYSTIFEFKAPESTTEKVKNIEDFWIAPYFRLKEEDKSQLRSRLDNYRLTASDLTCFIDIAYAGPIEFFKRKVMRAPSDPSSFSLDLGNLVHETFEAVTNQKLDDDAALEFFSAALEKLDLTDSERQDLKDRGIAAISTSLKEFGSILRHPGGRAEVNLSEHHLIWNVNGAAIPITGKIDHINVNETDKTIEVYDFKTSNYRKEDWTKNLSTFKYALQLTFYKKLLELSPTYNKYKITGSHILFVTPDLDGKVYDKFFAYPEDFLEEFGDLVPKVFGHMKSLDFVDEDSPLHVFPDSANTIKQVREFIELL